MILYMGYYISPYIINYLILMTTPMYEIIKKMKQTLSYKKLARPTALKGLQTEEQHESLQNPYWNYSISQNKR